MTFEERVNQIRDAEQDVDKVLKAANLERNPKSNDRLELLLHYSAMMLGMLIGAGLILGPMILMYLSR